MRKFLFSGRKLGAFAATAATFVATTVASLFSKSSNTVASLNGTLSWLVSRLKMPFNSRVCSSSSNTFSNSSQEPHFLDSYELGDEYDYSDYEGWLDEEEGYDDHRFDEILDKSWEQEAVDEAINEEEPGQYPPGTSSSIGDIPF